MVEKHKNKKKKTKNKQKHKTKNKNKNKNHNTPTTPQPNNHTKTKTHTKTQNSDRTGESIVQLAQPASVEATVDVAWAQVRGRRSPMVGNLVVADLVLEPGVENNRELTAAITKRPKVRETNNSTRVIPDGRFFIRR